MYKTMIEGTSITKRYGFQEDSVWPLTCCHRDRDLFYRDVELFERQAISDQVSRGSQLVA